MTTVMTLTTMTITSGEDDKDANGDGNNDDDDNDLSWPSDPGRFPLVSFTQYPLHQQITYP